MGDEDALIGCCYILLHANVEVKAGDDGSNG
eukprot:CAMPEP_0172179218 /NCGR_PEP_ID=MMETSP1050-20130122/16489_1 /TAXON_ID=233186 /ORGANISM="Cryptomonas curvata, Strain CCAP979/52" /LENGTH=30 /DNA_ID= /DNA_START= /DNA_END= /DNA_ORIENTATION=